MRVRAVPDLLGWAGAIAAAMSTVLALLAGRPEVLLPVALAAAWWLAGVMATRARPDHFSARLLLSVGTCHLVAFAASALVGASGRSWGGWTAWMVAAAAALVYGMGFAALAALLAAFPDGRMRDRRSRNALLVLLGLAGAALPLWSALATPRIDLALHLQRASVEAPPPLPVLPGPDLSGLLPVLVVPGLAVLVTRSALSRGDERRRMLWPLVSLGSLVLLLAATPAGTALVGETWGLVFVPLAAAVPFALLAGMHRYRLLEVEMYAGRTLAYGVVVVLVLSAFAIAEALGARLGVAPAVAVTVLAALTAHPVRRASETVIDGWLTGGRTRGRALVRELAASIETVDPDSTASRVAQAVRDGLDVSWVEVEFQGRLLARAGPPVAAGPAVVVPFVADGQEVGALRCGPRRGGWSQEDAELMDLLGRHTGLALHGARLSAELAEQVQELAASRARLVKAEDAVRRQIERDLHDGIQQQLVVLLARLELLRASLEPGTVAETAAREAQTLARRSLSDLRSTVAGIHPALLTDRGVVAAVEAQADLLPVPVVLDVDPRIESRRFPGAVESAAYYVTCEAVTNVVKHAGAALVRIELTLLDDGGLQLAVADDGRGFGAPSAGTGLRGLGDRVGAVGGRLTVDSAPGAGTRVVARFPGMAEVTDA